MTAPTNTLGHPGGLEEVWGVRGGRYWTARKDDDNADLLFPWNVHVFDRMRRTDTQIASLLRAVTLPLRGVAWTLDGEGVDPAVAAFVADELKLDGGQRRRGGVSWGEHLREVLLALAWGFAPFETVYELGPARTPGAPARVAHLRSLALRPPRTLTEVRVTPDGDLLGVTQAPPNDTVGRDRALVAGTTPNDVFIPRDRLAYYCLDREGADWTGTSLLRAAYKDWYLKETLVRAAGQAVDRNSMGLPVVEYEDDGDRELALQIAQAARAGETAGLAIPKGRMGFALVGVSGQTVDPLPMIHYHDQAMTRAALAMFLDLGHDAGARSLGETFVDFFTSSLRSIAEWVGATATDEVIRPLVALNFGPDTPYPSLVSEQITARHAATAEALKTLVDSGVVTPDEPLEAQTRRAYGLPPADPATAAPPATSDRAMEPTAFDNAVDEARALTDRLATLARMRA